MVRVLPALVALLLLACGLPSAATAQGSTNAPPGNAGIDEYLETVPGATGSHVPRPPRDKGTGAATLTPAERRRLERLGPDGKLLADTVEATTAAPAWRRAPAAPDAPEAEAAKAPPASAQGRSPLAEALDVAAGDDRGDGMGMLLPAILVVSLLGVVALVAIRRRPLS